MGYNAERHIVTQGDLYKWISSGFTNRHDTQGQFLLQTLPFRVDEQLALILGIENPVVDCHLSSEKVRERLETICHILSDLSLRTTMGKPYFSKQETYEAFSVIACNWLSIHGCFDDGHGRATIQLFPITLMKAGYPEDFHPNQFEHNGQFNIMRATQAIFLLNGHVKPGVRILAAMLELDRENGNINDLLLSPFIIGHKATRDPANHYALRKVYSFFREVYGDSERRKMMAQKMFSFSS